MDVEITNPEKWDYTTLSDLTREFMMLNHLKWENK